MLDIRLLRWFSGLPPSVRPEVNALWPHDRENTPTGWPLTSIHMCFGTDTHTHAYTAKKIKMNSITLSEENKPVQGFNSHSSFIIFEYSVFYSVAKKSSNRKHISVQPPPLSSSYFERTSGYV